MKKKVLSLLLAGSMVLSMAACGKTADNQPVGVPEVGTVDQSTFEGDGTEIEGGSSSELVDGKFAETRHITVETAAPIPPTTCTPSTSRRVCLRITT